MAEDCITAFGEVTAAEELALQSPYAHASRSTICYHSRLVQCAVREAGVFLKMRPEDASAYIVLGHARELKGRDEEALAAYTEAKRRHAEQLAKALRAAGREDEARQWDGGIGILEVKTK